MKKDNYELINKCLTGEATKAERDKLGKWLKASAEHRQIFTEVENIWQNADPPAPLELLESEQLWSKIKDKLNIGSQQPARIVPFRKKAAAYNWSRRAFALAASIVLLLGGSFLFQKILESNSWLVIATQNAQRVELSLPDGSVVHLNSASTLRYPTEFSDSLRIVHLQGEAFFEVTHHHTPFIVETDNAKIRVLGTEFNIWARDAQTRVIVNEGYVSLTALEPAKNSGVVLSAQQMSICRNDAEPEPPNEVDSQKLLGWLQNKIVFEQTPLSEIVAELQRFYDVAIKLADPALDKVTLTGSFQDKPVEVVIESLCLTLNLEFTYSNNKYIIGSRNH